MKINKKPNSDKGKSNQIKQQSMKKLTIDQANKTQGENTAGMKKTRRT
jgi:hypothetical protein